ncbi:MAG: ribose 5-phosphate isomerase B [Candidatus Zixiibacteriota bacterium]
MKISIASDHGGFELKEKLVAHLKKSGYKLNDHGTYSEESVDYPNFAQKVTADIVDKKADRGILICGTGIGMSIAANKVNGIRCGLCTSIYHAKMTRAHNNANILALGGRFTKLEDASKIAETFLTTSFEGGRHQRRIDIFEK